MMKSLMTDPRTRRRPAPLAAALLLAAVMHPAGAEAQLRAESRGGNLAINAGLGGAVGGVRAVIAGRPVWPAVVRGAGGGMLHSVGKQLTAADVPAAGLLARGVSAAGISLIGSAERDTLLLMVPLGIVTLRWQTRGGQPVRARVNALNLVRLVQAAADEDNALDLGASLKVGAPVFRHDGTIDSFNGFEQSGLILVQDGLPAEALDEILRHEDVHLLQEDAWGLLVAIPVERALLSRIPHADAVLQYVDPGYLTDLTWIAGNELVPYTRRPWEVEAYYLTAGRRWRDRFRGPP